MRIKQEVLEKLKTDVGVRGRLCSAVNKSYATIMRWVDSNDEGLTLAASLRVLREEYNLTDEEILEDGNGAV